MTSGPSRGVLTAADLSWTGEPPGTGRPATTWAERAESDPSLRAYVEATVERERIALRTARDERDHWKAVAERLHEQLDALRAERRAARKAARPPERAEETGAPRPQPRFRL